VTAFSADESGLIHRALLYGSPQEFLAGVLPFIDEGLHHGEPVLAVTSEDNSSLLREQLGAAADDVQFVDHVTWYDAPGRTLAACHRYLREHINGHDRVRVVGEPVWTGRDALETAEWKRFDALVNVAFAETPTSMLCPYDSRTVPAEVVADARRTHPWLDGDRNKSYLDPAAFFAVFDKELPPPAEPPTVIGFRGDPGPVRQFVAGQARRLGLPQSRVDDLVFIVNEVATNAIRHGAGYGQVLVWREGGRLLCEVNDPGEAKGDLFGAIPPDLDSEHGHGLWVARQLCDLLEIRTRQPGTTVRVHMRLPD
jgi:anti-sigma regulatory factor (Ser/Thr protein kinase)